MRRGASLMLSCRLTWCGIPRLTWSHVSGAKYLHLIDSCFGTMRWDSTFAL